MNCAAFVLLWASLLPLSPSSLQTPEILEIHRCYERLRDEMYNEGPITRIESLYQQTRACIDEASLDCVTHNYWLSRVEYVMGRAYQVYNNKQDAVSHYESGIEYTESAMEGGEFSEGWRMMSENLSQLCLQKDLVYIIRNGPKVRDYAKKALDLDPKNVPALIILAAGRIYPPVLFGGNPKRGIELMLEALQIGKAEKDDLFNIYSGIGVAYSKLDNNEQAMIWFEKALAIYPNNRYVNEEYKKTLR